MPINDRVASDTWYRYRWCVENGHFPFLVKAQRCDDFFAGNQWEVQDLNRLQLQRRPSLTINKIISTMSTIMGEQIYNRNETSFRPAGEGSNSDTADALTKVYTQIAQNNQLNWTRSDVFADGIIRSRGFYDVRMNFDNNMKGEVDISILNSKNVIIDPDAEEYDPDAWNDVFITKWLTAQDIEMLYSKEDAEYLKLKESSLFPYAYDSIERVRDRFAGPQLQSSYYGMLDLAHVRRCIRVLERQHHLIDMQKHFVDRQTGDMRPVPDEWDRNRIADVIAKTGNALDVVKKKVKRVRWIVTADNVVLHDDWSPYKHFTVVPYFPHFRHGNTIGLVENLLGPQELLNKVSSQELHIVNTSANSGWMTKAGNLINMSIEELEESGGKSGLILELQDVDQTKKIVPNPTPQGIEHIGSKAEDHMKSISGVSDSMQGFDRADVAAKAIQAKKQSGHANMVKVLDNLERTDFILARNVLDLVQEFYTEERIIHIVHAGVQNEAEQITVNQADPATGEIANDLTVGTYGIVITSTPERATLEDSQFEQAVSMKEQGLQIPDEVLIENSRLMNRGEIIKKMKAAADSPEAQQKAQLEMRMLSAQVDKMEGEAGEKKTKSALDQARTQKETIEAQQMGQPGGAEAVKAQHDMQIEQQRLQMEQQAEAARIQMETERMQQEFALKREQMQAEMAMKREMHEQEMALRREEAAQRQEQARQDATLKRQAELTKQKAAKAKPTTT